MTGSLGIVLTIDDIEKPDFMSTSASSLANLPPIQKRNMLTAHHPKPTPRLFATKWGIHLNSEVSWG